MFNAEPRQDLSSNINFRVTFDCAKALWRISRSFDEEPTWNRALIHAKQRSEIKWLELSSGGNMEHILPSGIDRVFLLHARLAKVAKRFESSQVDISSQV
ncbi:PREDICTED: uncharacterized protein LOC105565192 isoform X2 [Vollenhovia emeryi]|uniref:uncharacterized protein LOC105565192 isoform X2 n=1 Tax=Vollenhovia emeryi TaxID=411798 RepID=UPI0005F4F86D|nr:PREDICTED: uncharacterized protein LOC105565192 isoform X2 [Vollenhovia emeryi]